MLTVINWVRNLFVSEEGQTLTEYALILFLVVIAVVAVLGLLGGQILAVFNQIIAAL
jgi:Flp pilus assembly pilin Flp